MLCYNGQPPPSGFVPRPGVGGSGNGVVAAAPEPRPLYHVACGERNSVLETTPARAGTTISDISWKHIS